MDRQEEYRSCVLCPRNCRANRLEGELGVCHAPAELLVARAALHMWEEPCISGTEGSGAVFFSGCSLGCIYCQNGDISAGRAGEIISVERLAEIFLELQEQQANNINLVTAAHYVPSVASSLEIAKRQGLKIPVVYNSSGYEKTETLKQLEGLVEIYLPDMKYLDSEQAAEYSRARNYPEIAKAAIDEMVRQCPVPMFDSRGIMTKGVIVRHLLLPGHRRESQRVVRYLYETYSNRIYISMMSQYTPVSRVKGHPLLGRRVTKREYEKLLDYAIELGVENGFFQEGDVAKESFIPAFDGEGVKK